MLIQNNNMVQSSWEPAERAVAGSAAARETAAAPVAVEKPVDTAKQTDQKAGATHLQKSLDKVNELLAQSNTDLQFSIDKDTQRTVVKLVDNKSGEVIRQIPTEEALAISRSIDRIQNGMLLNRRA